MTTALAPSLPFRIFQPDTLLETLKIDLTEDQRTFLKANKTILRTPLTKQFNLKFGTKYSKLQLNRAIEVMNTPVYIPASKKRFKGVAQSGVKNVYWINKRKRWCVQFKVNKKQVTVGYYVELEKAVFVAEEYRNNLA